MGICRRRNSVLCGLTDYEGNAGNCEWIRGFLSKWEAEERFLQSNSWMLMLKNCHSIPGLVKPFLLM